LYNENIDILCALCTFLKHIKVLLMANVQGGNLHHPDTEAIKGRCIRTNFHQYILKCIKCPVDLATAVEERNISQLDIKLQERRLKLWGGRWICLLSLN
jgi:hypothetical protein